MTLSAKEKMLLEDLKSEEEVCIERYNRYANDAYDGGLKNMFDSLAKTEQQHLNTINTILGGTVPSQNSGGEQAQGCTCKSQCTGEQKNCDAFLCNDALCAEKHVSSVYNTSIFEFADVNLRNTLNHIQKEEQEHGEKIYAYMSANNMYN